MRRRMAATAARRALQHQQCSCWSNEGNARGGEEENSGEEDMSGDYFSDDDDDWWEEQQEEGEEGMREETAGAESGMQARDPEGEEDAQSSSAAFSDTELDVSGVE